MLHISKIAETTTVRFFVEAPIREQDVENFKEFFKFSVLKSLNRAEYEFQAARMLPQSLWFGSQVVQFEFILIIVRSLNER
jgi:hypothetical protein